MFRSNLLLFATAVSSSSSSSSPPSPPSPSSSSSSSSCLPRQPQTTQTWCPGEATFNCLFTRRPLRKTPSDGILFKLSLKRKVSQFFGDHMFPLLGIYKAAPYHFVKDPLPLNKNLHRHHHDHHHHHHHYFNNFFFFFRSLVCLLLPLVEVSQGGWQDNLRPRQIYSILLLLIIITSIIFIRIIRMFLQPRHNADYKLFSAKSRFNPSQQ